MGRIFATFAVVLGVFVVVGCDGGGGSHGNPLFVYLTWRGDTSTTMTVNFQTEVAYPSIAVAYRLIPDSGSEPGEFVEVDVLDSRRLDHHKDKRWVHSVELVALTPGAKYEFSVLLNMTTLDQSGSHFFRTLPADTGASIRFINGGDLDVGDDAETLMLLASMEDPMFALIGGDLVYVDDSPAMEALEDRWDTWFERWESIMRTSEGCLVPLVMVLGDHEMDSVDPYAGGVDAVEFFLDFFDQNEELAEQSYFARTFGANMVIYALDSGNAISHADQREWLRAQMTQFAGIPHQFAVYHHPLYPAAKPFDDPVASVWAIRGREEWGPLFDEFGLDTAFEHDGHVFKQTFRLKAGVVDPAGTLYLGEGAFGRVPRTPEDRDYLETSGAIQHFWSVVVDDIGASYTAIDIDGVAFHTYPAIP